MAVPHEATLSDSLTVYAPLVLRHAYVSCRSGLLRHCALAGLPPSALASLLFIILLLFLVLWIERAYRELSKSRTGTDS